MPILLVTLLAAYASGTESSQFEAKYDVYRKDSRLGTLTRRFTLSPQGAYEYTSRIDAEGLLGFLTGWKAEETSRGRLLDGRLEPSFYQDNKPGNKRDFTLSIEQADHRAARLDSAEAYSWQPTLKTHDKLSYQLQITLDLRIGLSDFQYLVADKSRVKTYRFVRSGLDSVDTPLGRFDGLKLIRSDPGSRKQTTVWVAKQLSWHAVKVVYRDKQGVETAALIRSFASLPAHPKDRSVTLSEDAQ